MTWQTLALGTGGGIAILLYAALELWPLLQGRRVSGYDPHNDLGPIGPTVTIDISELERRQTP